MNKIKQYGAQVLGGLTALGVLASTLVARAAVDADISAATTALATTTKENTVGVVGANVQYVAIIFALMLGIAVIMRLTKRAAK